MPMHEDTDSRGGRLAAAFIRSRRFAAGGRNDVQGPGRLPPAGRSAAVPGGFLRRMPAALLLLAVALVLLLFGDGGVVQAQVAQRLVSNHTGNNSHPTAAFDEYDLAQKFTTGSNHDGYSLTEVDLFLTFPANGPRPTVKIFSGSANGSEVATLTDLGRNIWGAPEGTTLAKDTSYWVVAEGGNGKWYYTGTFESSSSAPGFSIADYRESRGKDTTGSFVQTMDSALEFQVYGTIPNTPATGAPAIIPPLILPPTAFHVPTMLGVDLSGISDPNGTWNMQNSATYKWQRFDATGSTLENASIGTASTYTLTDADVGKRLKVVVNFTDHANNSEGPLTSAATPVITPNAAPTSSNRSVTLEEDTTGVFGDSNFPYSDTDGDVRASVKITTLPAAGKGVLKVSNTVITDTELPRTLTYDELAFRWLSYTPPQNAFGSPYTTFKFKVNDGTADSALDYTMRINITSVDDPGRVLISGQSLFRELGATLTASVSDPDGNVTNASWQWMRGDTARGTYSNISGATAATHAMVEADVGKFLKAMVSYTDGDGSGKSATSNYVRATAIIGTKITTVSRTFTAFNVNENTATSVVIKTYESTNRERVTWKLEGDDRADFTITINAFGHGELRFAEVPNYEMPADAGADNVYDVRVRVTDSDINTDALLVRVTVDDVNEAPTITGRYRPSVPENSTAVITLSATDEDASDTLTWSVEISVGSEDDGSKFTIDPSSGALRFTSAPDFETPTDIGATAMNNTYVVVVKVTDAGGLSDTHPILVTVTATNEAPEITTVSRTDIAFNRPENIPTSAVIKIYRATGVGEGSALTWSLEGADRADFTITKNAQGHGELRFAKVPNYEMPADSDTDNVYDVTVKVTDSDTSTDALLVRVTVDDVNEAPTITGRHRQSVPENSTAVITLSATDEDASDTLTWSVEIWEDGGKFTIDPSSGALRFTSAPDFETPTDIGDTAMNNTYVVTVKVSDAGGLSDTHPIQVTVTIINEAPVITTVSRTYTAFNVPENTATSRTIKTYRATGVGEGSVLTWSLEGADRADFTITKNAQGHGELRFAKVPNYEMAADSDTDNVYDVTVKVTDSDTSTDALLVRVTVDDVNEAPTITGRHRQSVPENSTAVITLSATDEDASDTLTWSVEIWEDGGKFTIDPSSGALSFISAPDFETPTDIGDTAMNNTYVVTVKVSDAGGLSDTHPIQVTVTTINEAPEITTVSATYTAFNVNENTATSRTIKTYRATGVGEGSALTWSLEGADRADFTITKNAQGHGELRFARVPNYEMPADAGADNIYDVTVKVTDNHGSLPDTLMVRVTVDDVNEAPTITTVSRAYTAFNVDENTANTMVIKTYEATDVDAGSVLTWTLEGADRADFTIRRNAQGHGDLRFANAPNYEMPADAGANNVYDVTVKVTDAGGLSDTHPIQVTVTTINEAPEITTVSRTYIAFNRPENIPTSAVIKIYRATGVGEGSALTWSLEGADRADFTITKNAQGHGHLRFAKVPNYEMPADAGANNVYDVTVKVTDSDGSTDALMVKVTVDDVHEAPVITTVSRAYIAFNVDENTANTMVIKTYEATDVDAGSVLTWTLEGADRADFTIRRNAQGHGDLRFANAPNYEMPADAGANNVYDVTVKVTDAGGLSDTHPIQVTVTTINEAPEITTVSRTYIAFNRPENIPTSAVIKIYRATGVGEGSVLTWSLEGADRADFTITKNAQGQGQLRFAKVPNYEMAADAGADNIYDVTVKVTDSDGSTDALMVRVTVDDFNEAPVFTGAPALSVDVDEHDVNGEYVVMDLADYDARDEEGGVTWSLTGTDRGDFAISADGVVTFRAAPNFEAPADSGGNNVYNVTVVARDTASGSTRRSVSADVTVTVADVEEDGKIEVVNLNLDPAVGETVSFMLSDPDGGISSIEWKVQLRDPNPNNPDAGWASEPSDGTNTTTFRYLVDEDHAGKEIRAYVAYSDRRGSGKTATSQGTAAITATPIANAKPRFRGRSTRSIPEGGAGRDVGVPVEASDHDGDTLTFAIREGDSSEYFAINPSTGQIRTTQALDYETIPGLKRLSLTVTLHDGKGVGSNNMVIADDSVDATTTIAISIPDVEEDGVVTFSSMEPEVGTPLKAALADGDGGVSGEMWQWARSENGRTGWANISGEADATHTPTEADEDFYLRASVTYADRRGSGKSAEAVTSGPVPSENQGPLFPTPTPTATSTPTATPAPTPAPTATPASTLTATSTPTATPAPTPAPTATPASTLTATSTPTATPAPTPAPTAIPASTLTATSTPTATPAPTPAPTATPASTLTATSAPTATPAPTPAPTATPASTATPTPEPTPNPTPVAAPTSTAEPMAAATPQAPAVPTQPPTQAPAEETSEAEKGLSAWLWLALVIVILGLALPVYLYIRRRRSLDEDDNPS